tara:strand:+ start:1000 stop:1212 length:213 start_codon:yes stop_codon:yes gene_type:complete
MNISKFFNRYFNAIIIGGVFSVMLLMGTIFFFLFKYIGYKNKIYRTKLKKEFEIFREIEMNTKKEELINN